MGKQDLEKHPAIIKLKKEEEEASRRFNEEVIVNRLILDLPECMEPKEY